jgi:hypothetical protein
LRFEGLIGDVLPDENAGRQQNGFERKNEREQGERVFINFHFDPPMFIHIHNPTPTDWVMKK